MRSKDSATSSTSKALTAISTSKESVKLKGKDDMITKVEDFLKKNNKGSVDRELHCKPWYYGSISRQECMDLMADHAVIGDFLIIEASTTTRDFALSK